MKLYTEEELRRAIGKSRLSDGFVDGVFQLKYTIEEVLEQSLPIELPSDEEIEESSEKGYVKIDGNRILNWINGAKWMKEQILNQTK